MRTVKLVAFALIPGEPKAPGFDVVYDVFDAYCNSKVHLRSSLQSLPDELFSPFDRIVHDQRSFDISRIRRFGASSNKATPMGLPSSSIQHRDSRVLDTQGPTLIFSETWLLHF